MIMPIQGVNLIKPLIFHAYLQRRYLSSAFAYSRLHSDAKSR